MTGIITPAYSVSKRTGSDGAGAATVLTLVFGPALLAVWPLVVLIAWSRVQVGDHTPAQVLAGVALGIVVNATVFPLLR